MASLAALALDGFVCAARAIADEGVERGISDLELVASRIEATEPLVEMCLGRPRRLARDDQATTALG